VGSWVFDCSWHGAVWYTRNSKLSNSSFWILTLHLLHIQNLKSSSYPSFINGKTISSVIISLFHNFFFTYTQKNIFNAHLLLLLLLLLLEFLRWR
jgi:hypothetical protein